MELRRARAAWVYALRCAAAALELLARGDAELAAGLATQAPEDARMQAVVAAPQCAAGLAARFATPPPASDAASDAAAAAAAVLDEDTTDSVAADVTLDGFDVLARRRCSAAAQAIILEDFFGRVLLRAKLT